MKPIMSAILTLGVLLALTACQKGDEKAAATDAAASWPASLKVIGDGFPNPGDACRKIGETEATVDFLDDSATLAGCLSADDAAKLGGKVVGTVDGVTLVSVPMSAAIPGDGDGQGDAKVAGTDYNATAQVKCSGYKGAGSGMCDAGVMRNTEMGSNVDITLKDGTKRTIFFDKAGKFVSFSTAEADGTAAMKITSKRDGDTTIATLGTETYEIPDVFILGD